MGRESGVVNCVNRFFVRSAYLRILGTFNSTRKRDYLTGSFGNISLAVLGVKIVRLKRMAVVLYRQRVLTLKEPEGDKKAGSVKLTGAPAFKVSLVRRPAAWGTWKLGKYLITCLCITCTGLKPK